jgi:hypothetical protein
MKGTGDEVDGVLFSVERLTHWCKFVVAIRLKTAV